MRFEIGIIRFLVGVVCSNLCKALVNEEPKAKVDDFRGFVHSKSIGESADRPCRKVNKHNL